MGGYVTRKGKTYYAVVELDRDPLTGKRKRTWHPAGTTKRSAQRLLGQLLEDLDTNTYLEPEAITVGTYLVDEWLVSTKSELRFATYDSYRRNIENHVIPHIGAMRLQVLGATVEVVCQSRPSGTSIRRSARPSTMQSGSTTSARIRRSGPSRRSRPPAPTRSGTGRPRNCARSCRGTATTDTRRCGPSQRAPGCDEVSSSGSAGETST